MKINHNYMIDTTVILHNDHAKDSIKCSELLSKEEHKNSKLEMMVFIWW